MFLLGNSTVDEVMTSLISAVDVFHESQKGEILEEVSLYHKD